PRTFRAHLALDSSTPLPGRMKDLTDTGIGSINNNDTAADREFDLPTGGNYTLSLDSTGTIVQIFQGTNPTPIGSAAVGTFSTLTINGTAAGSELLKIDYSNGDPIPSGGFSFNGGTGAGTDTLAIIGSGLNAVYSPGAVTGSGTIVIDSVDTIHFSQLE